MRFSCARQRLSDPDKLRLHLAGHDGFACADEHIDLGTDAEIGIVEARLDREQRPGQNAPFVVRFQVVHIGTGPMNLFPDGMPRAMNKVVDLASGSDVSAGRVVNLETPYGATARNG